MSKVMQRNFTTVTFMLNGMFFSDTFTKVTKITDPKAIAKKAPKGAYCFYFKNWVKKMAVVDGERFEKTEQVGKSSAKHYVGVKLYTLAQLKKKFGDDKRYSILLKNMEYNSYNRAIYCRTGNWHGLKEEDVFVKV